MTDLVSRLLEAIEQTEREARERRGVWPRPGVQDNGAVWLHIKRGGQAVVVHYLHPVEGYGDMADLKAWAEAERGQDEDAVLRRCAADRKLVDLHGIVHRNIGWLEWDEGEHAEMYAELPVCGLCVPKHSSFPRREDVPVGPCRTVRILAEGYGLSDHQEGEE